MQLMYGWNGYEWILHCMQQLQDTIWQIESNILLTEEFGGVIGWGWARGRTWSR